MSDSCRTFRDSLLAETVDELTATEQQSLARHLGECSDCSKLRLVLEVDDRRLSAFVSSTDATIARLQDRIMERVRGSEPSTKRTRFEKPRFHIATRLR